MDTMDTRNTDSLTLAILSQVVKDKPMQKMLATEAFLQAQTPLMQKVAYDNLMNKKAK